MPSYEDLWYAAKLTEIVYMPSKILETFGESRVKYLILSEDMENPSKICLRSGVVLAERPRIITPQYFIQQNIQNFNADARKYFSEVLSGKQRALFVQYGLNFRKEAYTEEFVMGQIQEIAHQAAGDAQDNLQEMRGVIIAPDDGWEISLMKFITELVQKSAPYHMQQLSRHGDLTLVGGVPKSVHNEIEKDFTVCNSLNKAKELGAKLRDYGIFENYEDRFYELFRRLKKA
ncbi:MAG: hypothetical protein WCS73_05920 [Lentisphaeria bacterium]